MAETTKSPVQIAGRQVDLTNLQKLYWPESGFTKGDLVEYYVRISPWLLPHLHGRPLVLTRYRDGRAGKWFYQKDAPPGKPDWAVIDLDPSDGVEFIDVLTVVRLVRQLLAAVRVTGFPKLSGATGIHIHCPCGPGYTYEETAGFCEALERVLIKIYPQRVTLERVVARRTGKIYVDYRQNRRGQTITAPCGLRPLTGAPVSAPVTWDELELDPPRFTIMTIWTRLEQVGDLFSSALTLSQDLRRAKAELDEMR